MEQASLDLNMVSQEQLSPNEFEAEGFAIAEEHYAGSEDTPSLLHANSSHAVSQYNIACYQFTQNH
ncbi:MAG: hypothetical protein Q7S44_00420 [bacterium]|nr:hypothetical protein [bacterium]